MLVELKLLNALAFDVSRVSGPVRRPRFEQLAADLQDRVSLLTSSQTGLAVDRFAAIFGDYAENHQQLIEKDMCGVEFAAGELSLKQSSAV